MIMLLACALLAGGCAHCAPQAAAEWKTEEIKVGYNTVAISYGTQAQRTALLRYLERDPT